MQIGADIYCDSLCIIREIERRHPSPTLYPGGSNGIAWGLSRWTDGELLTLCVGLVLGSAIEDLPADFAADRGRLYFGPDFDLHAHGRDRPHKLAQLRTHLSWVEEGLNQQRQFMLGDSPALPDALIYYTVWFLRGRYAGGAELLNEFPALLAWEQRMLALGHGESSDLTSAQALEIARAAKPQTPVTMDANDPQRFAAGANVQVQPDGNGGDPMVTGKLRALTRDIISIDRVDPSVGDITVHFPRAGYRIESA